MAKATVVRQWKRDRTINRMTLEAAVLNLASRADALEGETWEARAARVRQALLRGEDVETPHAVFRVIG